MKKIYLPLENLNDFPCISVYDKDTIRAYFVKPAYNSNSNYIDFYINSHYLEKQGNQSWGSQSYYASLPVCLPETSLTNEVYYRTDFTSSLLAFSLLVLIMFWVPLKLTFFRLFKRFN
jgi:hypothetical protein